MHVTQTLVAFTNQIRLINAMHKNIVLLLIYFIFPSTLPGGLNLKKSEDIRYIYMSLCLFNSDLVISLVKSINLNELLTFGGL